MGIGMKKAEIKTEIKAYQAEKAEKLANGLMEKVQYLEFLIEYIECDLNYDYVKETILKNDIFKCYIYVWKDQDGNKWFAKECNGHHEQYTDFGITRKYTHAEAKKASMSLVNCKNCLNCEDCANSTNLINCNWCNFGNLADDLWEE